MLTRWSSWSCLTSANGTVPQSIPSEKRKVAGSIPALATRNAQVSQNAQAVSDRGWRPITIPYEGIGLHGYYSEADDGGPRPTLLAHGGSDSTAEEMYSPSAGRRGWNWLIGAGEKN
jgi:hypothetical protein